jgi:hypothetical protein
MVETEISLLQALQHRISDRILALAQHALDLGMKYAVLDIHRQDGLICVITTSYPMAKGIAQTAVHHPLQVVSLTSIVAVGDHPSGRAHLARGAPCKGCARQDRILTIHAQE